MVVIKNGQAIVSGVNGAGVVRYANQEADREPLRFRSEIEAATWWAEHAPTSPPIGQSSVSVEPVS